jgi:16S rRNA G966 N2-methylase RsmD
MIGQNLSEVRFLDAFGGSGIMGVEAYSRGANVTICEKRRGAFLAIKNLVHKKKWPIELIFGSTETVLDQTWDIIFMDPPYLYDSLPWIQMAENHTKELLIFEHSSRTSTPEEVGSLIKTKKKTYGDCALSFYEPQS